jgi:gluconolactonase
MRYPVLDDGRLGPGSVFFDMTAAPEEEAIDGIEVGRHGHLFVSGPGGTWVLAPDGRHLGTIIGPRPTHNFAWGGPGGSDLYMTSRSALYRMPLLTGGPSR